MNKELLKFIDKLPKMLITLIVINCLYGFLVLYSAGYNHLDQWAFKQIINFLIFFPIMIFIAYLDLRVIFKYSYIFYFCVLGMLIAVELFGYSAMGAKRWLSIGGIRVQPSEPAKIAIVLFLARYFHSLNAEHVGKIRYLIPAIIAVIVPAALIIKQPDLGTGMVLLGVSGMIFFASGVRLWKFGAVFSSAIIALPFIWSKLHDYQKKRIEVFLKPDQDPLGSGYNIIQSKIAIGSGGFFGKGLGQGTQSHLSFLPEHQTDFIFGCLAEDLGFVGATILILLYSLIIYMSLSIAINAKNIFGKLVAAGVISIFFCHVCINIGMVSGLLPVVGIPLPLISYGGTMMASILIGFGLILNIHVNQYSKL